VQPLRVAHTLHAIRLVCCCALSALPGHGGEHFQPTRRLQEPPAAVMCWGPMCAQGWVQPSSLPLWYYLSYVWSLFLLFLASLLSSGTN
jgi:hypothetical protein